MALVNEVKIQRAVASPSNIARNPSDRIFKESQYPSKSARAKSHGLMVDNRSVDRDWKSFRANIALRSSSAYAPRCRCTFKCLSHVEGSKKDAQPLQCVFDQSHDPGAN